MNWFKNKVETADVEILPVPHMYLVLFKTCRLHYKQCNLAMERHRWRQYIRLHTDSFEDTKGLKQHFHIGNSSPQDLFVIV